MRVQGNASFFCTHQPVRPHARLCRSQSPLKRLSAFQSEIAEKWSDPNLQEWLKTRHTPDTTEPFDADAPGEQLAPAAMAMCVGTNAILTPGSQAYKLKVRYYAT